MPNMDLGMKICLKRCPDLDTYTADVVSSIESSHTVKCQSMDCNTCMCLQVKVSKCQRWKVKYNSSAPVTQPPEQSDNSYDEDSSDSSGSSKYEQRRSRARTCREWRKTETPSRQGMRATRGRKNGFYSMNQVTRDPRPSRCELPANFPTDKLLKDCYVRLDTHEVGHYFDPVTETYKYSAQFSRKQGEHKLKNQAASRLLHSKITKQTEPLKPLAINAATEVSKTSPEDDLSHTTPVLESNITLVSKTETPSLSSQKLETANCSRKAELEGNMSIETEKLEAKDEARSLPEHPPTPPELPENLNATNKSKTIAQTTNKLSEDVKSETKPTLTVVPECSPVSIVSFESSQHPHTNDVESVTKSEENVLPETQSLKAESVSDVGKILPECPLVSPKSSESSHQPKSDDVGSVAKSNIKTQKCKAEFIADVRSLLPQCSVFPVKSLKKFQKVKSHEITPVAKSQVLPETRRTDSASISNVVRSLPESLLLLENLQISTAKNVAKLTLKTNLDIVNPAPHLSDNVQECVLPATKKSDKITEIVSRLDSSSSLKTDNVVEDTASPIVTQESVNETEVTNKLVAGSECHKRESSCKTNKMEMKNDLNKNKSTEDSDEETDYFNVLTRSPKKKPSSSRLNMRHSDTENEHSSDSNKDCYSQEPKSKAHDKQIICADFCSNEKKELKASNKQLKTFKKVSIKIPSPLQSTVNTDLKDVKESKTATKQLEEAKTSEISSTLCTNSNCDLKDVEESKAVKISSEISLTSKLDVCTNSNSGLNEVKECKAVTEQLKVVKISSEIPLPSKPGICTDSNYDLNEVKESKAAIKQLEVVNTSLEISPPLKSDTCTDSNSNLNDVKGEVLAKQLNVISVSTEVPLKPTLCMNSKSDVKEQCKKVELMEEKDTHADTVPDLLEELMFAFKDEMFPNDSTDEESSDDDSSDENISSSEDEDNMPNQGIIKNTFNMCHNNAKQPTSSLHACQNDNVTSKDEKKGSFGCSTAEPHSAMEEKTAVEELKSSGTNNSCGNFDNNMVQLDINVGNLECDTKSFLSEVVELSEKAQASPLNLTEMDSGLEAESVLDAGNKESEELQCCSPVLCDVDVGDTVVAKTLSSVGGEKLNDSNLLTESGTCEDTPDLDPYEILVEEIPEIESNNHMAIVEENITELESNNPFADLAEELQELPEMVSDELLADKELPSIEPQHKLNTDCVDEKSPKEQKPVNEVSTVDGLEVCANLEGKELDVDLEMNHKQPCESKGSMDQEINSKDECIDSSLLKLDASKVVDPPKVTMLSIEEELKDILGEDSPCSPRSPENPTRELVLKSSELVKPVEENTLVSQLELDKDFQDATLKTEVPEEGTLSVTIFTTEPITDEDRPFDVSFSSEMLDPKADNFDLLEEGKMEDIPLYDNLDEEISLHEGEVSSDLQTQQVNSGQCKTKEKPKTEGKFSKRKKVKHMFNCAGCDKNFNSKSRICFHIENIHLSHPGTCCSCEFESESILHLMTHIRDRHREENNTKNLSYYNFLQQLRVLQKIQFNLHGPLMPKPSLPFVCVMCRHRFKQDIDLRVHKNTLAHINREKLLQQYKKAVKGSKRSSKANHKEPENLPSRFWTTLQSQLSQRSTNNKNKRLSVKLVKKAVNLKHRSHAATASPLNPESQTVMSTLKIHAKRSKIHLSKKTSSIKKYQCPECSKTFSHRSNLILHLKNKKSRNSMWPKQKFEKARNSMRPKQKLQRKTDWLPASRDTDQSQLTSSMWEKAFPFACDKCPNRFKSKKDIERHMMINKHPVKFYKRPCMLRTALKKIGISIKQFKCHLCSQVTMSLLQLERHIVTTHLENNKEKKPLVQRRISNIQVYFCDYCGQTFKFLQSLALHVKMSHHENNQEKDSIKPIKVKAQKFFCNLCQMDLSFEKNFKAHLNSAKHMSAAFRRNITSAYSTTKQDPTIASEIEASNCKMQLTNCAVCTEKFQNQEELNSHIVQHLRLKPSGSRVQLIPVPLGCFYCNDCQKPFVCLNDLNHHINSTTNHDNGHIEFTSPTTKKEIEELGLDPNAVVHGCSLCDASFNSKFMLQRHQTSCHGIQLERTVCDTAKDPNTEEEPQNEVLKPPQYHCESCKYVTISNDKFQQHLLTHKSKVIGVINVCALCNTQFSSLLELQNHLSQTHSVKLNIDLPLRKKLNIDLPLRKKLLRRCYLCGKRFKSNSALQSHIQSEHPFKDQLHMCSICSYNTTMLYRLINHMETEHGSIASPSQQSDQSEESSLFTCKKCAETFTDQLQLETHITSEHSGEKSPKKYYYQCEHCDFSANNFSHYNEHVKLWHSKNIKYIKLVENGKIKFKCAYRNCPFICKKVSPSMARHFKRMHCSINLNYKNTYQNRMSATQKIIKMKGKIQKASLARRKLKMALENAGASSKKVVKVYDEGSYFGNKIMKLQIKLERCKVPSDQMKSGPTTTHNVDAGDSSDKGEYLKVECNTKTNFYKCMRCPATFPTYPQMQQHLQCHNSTEHNSTDRCVDQQELNRSVESSISVESQKIAEKNIESETVPDLSSSEENFISVSKDMPDNSESHLQKSSNTLLQSPTIKKETKPGKTEQTTVIPESQSETLCFENENTITHSSKTSPKKQNMKSQICKNQISSPNNTSDVQSYSQKHEVQPEKPEPGLDNLKVVQQSPTLETLPQKKSKSPRKKVLSPKKSPKKMTARKNNLLPKVNNYDSNASDICESEELNQESNMDPPSQKHETQSKISDTGLNDLETEKMSLALQTSSKKKCKSPRKKSLSPKKTTKKIAEAESDNQHGSQNHEIPDSGLQNLETRELLLNLETSIITKSKSPRKNSLSPKKSRKEVATPEFDVQNYSQISETLDPKVSEPDLDNLKIKDVSLDLEASSQRKSKSPRKNSLSPKKPTKKIVGLETGHTSQVDSDPIDVNCIMKILSSDNESEKQTEADMNALPKLKRSSPRKTSAVNESKESSSTAETENPTVKLEALVHKVKNGMSEAEQHEIQKSPEIKSTGNRSPEVANDDQLDELIPRLSTEQVEQEIVALKSSSEISSSGTKEIKETDLLTEITLAQTENQVSHEDGTFSMSPTSCGEAVVEDVTSKLRSRSIKRYNDGEELDLQSDDPEKTKCSKSLKLDVNPSKSDVMSSSKGKKKPKCSKSDKKRIPDSKDYEVTSTEISYKQCKIKIRVPPSLRMTSPSQELTDEYSETRIEELPVKDLGSKLSQKQIKVHNRSVPEKSLSKSENQMKENIESEPTSVESEDKFVQAEITKKIVKKMPPKKLKYIRNRLKTLRSRKKTLTVRMQVARITRNSKKEMSVVAEQSQSTEAIERLLPQLKIKSIKGKNRNNRIERRGRPRKNPVETRDRPLKIPVKTRERPRKNPVERRGRRRKIPVETPTMDQEDLTIANTNLGEKCNILVAPTEISEHAGETTELTNSEVEKNEKYKIKPRSKKYQTKLKKSKSRAAKVKVELQPSIQALSPEIVIHPTVLVTKKSKSTKINMELEEVSLTVHQQTELITKKSKPKAIRGKNRPSSSFESEIQATSPESGLSQTKSTTKKSKAKTISTIIPRSTALEPVIQDKLSETNTQQAKSNAKRNKSKSGSARNLPNATLEPVIQANLPEIDLPQTNPAVKRLRSKSIGDETPSLEPEIHEILPACGLQNTETVVKRSKSKSIGDETLSLEPEIHEILPDCGLQNTETVIKRSKSKFVGDEIFPSTVLEPEIQATVSEFGPQLKTKPLTKKSKSKSICAKIPPSTELESETQATVSEMGPQLKIKPATKKSKSVCVKIPPTTALESETPAIISETGHKLEIKRVTKKSKSKSVKKPTKKTSRSTSEPAIQTSMPDIDVTTEQENKVVSIPYDMSAPSCSWAYNYNPIDWIPELNEHMIEDEIKSESQFQGSDSETEVCFESSTWLKKQSHRKLSKFQHIEDTTRKDGDSIKSVEDAANHELVTDTKNSQEESNAQLTSDQEEDMPLAQLLYVDRGSDVLSPEKETASSQASDVILPDKPPDRKRSNSESSCNLPSKLPRNDTQDSDVPNEMNVTENLVEESPKASTSTDFTFKSPQAIEPNPSQCDICKKIFSHSGSVKQHKERVHKIPYERAQKNVKKNMHRNQKRENKQIPMNCDVCQKTLSSKRSLDRHMKSYHEVVYSCNKCDFSSMDTSEYAAHVNSHQQDVSHEEEKFSDTTIDTTESEDSFSLNTSASSGEFNASLFTCCICSKQLTTKKSLSRHLKKLHDIHSKIWQCKNCNFCTFDYESLQNHAEIHLTNIEADASAPPQEEVVKQEIVSDSTVAEESKEQTTESVPDQSNPTQETDARPFPCPMCNLSYKLNTSLKRHIRMKHTTDSVPNTMSSEGLTNAENQSSKDANISLELNTENTEVANQNSVLEPTNQIVNENVAKCDEITNINEVHLNIESINETNIECDGNDHTTFELNIQSSDTEDSKSMLNVKSSDDSQVTVELEMHPKVTFKCADCGNTFKNKLLLKIHILKIHPQKKKSFQCQFCKTSAFRNKGSLIIHTRKYHELAVMTKSSTDHKSDLARFSSDSVTMEIISQVKSIQSTTIINSGDTDNTKSENSAGDIPSILPETPRQSLASMAVKKSENLVCGTVIDLPKSPRCDDAKIVKAENSIENTSSSSPEKLGNSTESLSCMDTECVTLENSVCDVVHDLPETSKRSEKYPECDDAESVKSASSIDNALKSTESLTSMGVESVMAESSSRPKKDSDLIEELRNFTGSLSSDEGENIKSDNSASGTVSDLPSELRKSTESLQSIDAESVESETSIDDVCSALPNKNMETTESQDCDVGENEKLENSASGTVRDLPTELRNSTESFNSLNAESVKLCSIDDACNSSLTELRKSTESLKCSDDDDVKSENSNSDPSDSPAEQTNSTECLNCNNDGNVTSENTDDGTVNDLPTELRNLTESLNCNNVGNVIPENTDDITVSEMPAELRNSTKSLNCKEGENVKSENSSDRGSELTQELNHSSECLNSVDAESVEIESSLDDGCTALPEEITDSQNCDEDEIVMSENLAIDTHNDLPDKLKNSIESLNHNEGENVKSENSASCTSDVSAEHRNSTEPLICDAVNNVKTENSASGPHSDLSADLRNSSESLNCDDAESVKSENSVFGTPRSVLNLPEKLRCSTESLNSMDAESVRSESSIGSRPRRVTKLPAKLRGSNESLNSVGTESVKSESSISSRPRRITKLPAKLRGSNESLNSIGAESVKSENSVDSGPKRSFTLPIKLRNSTESLSSIASSTESGNGREKRKIKPTAKLLESTENKIRSLMSQASGDDVDGPKKRKLSTQKNNHAKSPRTYYNRKKLKSAKLSSSVNNTERLCCQECFVQFNSVPELNYHINAVHLSTSSKEPRMDSAIDLTKLHCRECLINIDCQEISDHYTTVHRIKERTYVCIICSYTTVVKYRLEKHMLVHL